jgi:hypothetical protein
VLDVRPVLQTEDHPLIAVSYRGIRRGAPDVIERLERGESPDPASYCIRIKPMFETSAPKCEWINRLLAVGIGQRRADGPIYSPFEVL